jgi:ribosomal protein S2
LVLFVGTREGHARAVVKAAQMAKGCHLFTKWIPGSITNGQQILGGCAKKVVDELDQEVEGFEDQLGTKAALKPDLVVCLNPLENYVLLHECGLNNIPTIGIIDTDANPTWVTYPIPANDDSLRCVQVVAGVLGRAGQEGQEARAKLAKRGIVSYSATHGLNSPAGKERSKVQRRERTLRRQEQVEAPAAAVASEVTLDEPNYDEDLVGVSVAQHEEDQRLLDQAESMLGGASLESAVTSPPATTSTTPSLEAEEEDIDEDESRSNHLYTNPDEDLNFLDQSLVNENYPSASSAENDFDPSEAFSQFGGQIEADRERIAFESQGKQKRGDVMEQVEGVAEELGESQGQGKVEANEVKDVEREVQPEVDAAVEAAKAEEPIVAGKKGKGRKE